MILEQRARSHVAIRVLVAMAAIIALAVGAFAPPAHGASPVHSNTVAKSEPSEPHTNATSSCASGSGGAKVCVYAETNDLKVVFTNMFLAEGAIEFNGEYTGTAIQTTVQVEASSTYNESVPSDYYTGGACGILILEETEVCAMVNLYVPGSGGGYWLSAAKGAVFGAGNARVDGSISTSATTDPVVGIASTPDGKGYWEVTRNGSIAHFGDAGNYNDLPGLHVTVDDIVAIAPTSDGKGYWLVGADGGEFAFGDAGYHGSLPGLHIHVDDVAGMVATPNGKGYLLVGNDGGVFVFGGHYWGSLPGLKVKVHDVVGILPTGAESGYVLVGADGGSFVFGTGSGYYGSLPGRKITESDVVGIALTPDQKGYWMAGADGTVYNFGDASYFGTPSGTDSALPVSAIAGT
jgi:hypothetical protein